MRPITNLVIYEEDLSRINACLSALQRKARSAAVLLIDTSGQLIASAGETDALDTTPLASLAAGSVAAAGALAQLLGEKEFSFVFYDGERKRLHLSLIGGRAILLVLLDQNSAVALVRRKISSADSFCPIVWPTLEIVTPVPPARVIASAASAVLMT